MIAKLQTSIEFLKGVGPNKAEVLQKELQIFTWEDLLKFYPFRYIDKSKFYTIAEIAEDGAYIQIRGKLTGFQLIGAMRKQRLVGKFQDETGEIELVWFKSAEWVIKSLKVGVEYVAYGKPTKFGSKFNIAHPEMKPITEVVQQQNAWEPVYNSSEKMKKFNLDSKGMLQLMRNLFATIEPFDLLEIFPFDVLDNYKLLSRYQSFKNVHLPENNNTLEKAIFRLKFEELMLIQLRLLKLKINRSAVHRGFFFEKVDNKFEQFYKEKLPFELTNAQKRVLKEIRKDTLSGKQMNRLLQGDVGSGKTIVALMSMLMAIDNDFQACLMAPTEILAQQHFEGLSELLKNTGINISILTGSSKTAARKQLHAALESGELHIVIGTHALLEDKVKFKNLGFVVIDEQHRFGVAQRAKLWAKNTQPPHILVMTATPIPRTLAMTFYGDLDVSVIDELPPGRKPITTIHKRESAREVVFGAIKRELEKGRQTYIVYPLIEESATLDYNHLMDGFESVSRAFPQYAISIVHGKMKPADKDYEMQRFVKGETKIMVATTVIEVGVNVPNASLMLIESAERFGLSQLHQLRGRVGRGAEQSYCILMTGLKLSTEARQRMQIMCETNDGFRIAEEDLKLRGPGDIEGTQQSGISDLKLANIAKDSKILSLARQVATEILEEDPLLDLKKNELLKETLQAQARKKGWGRIS